MRVICRDSKLMRLIGLQPSHIEHCFLRCQYVKEIWRELKKDYGICLKLNNFIHIRKWLLDRISEATELHSMIMAVAIWHIWDNRNNIRNGESLVHPSRVLGKIKAYIDFICLHSFSSNGSDRRDTSKSTQKWSPPPKGLMLVNVDAAIFTQSGRAGFGIVIRDNQGKVRLASRGRLQCDLNPEVAEALALREALTTTKVAGFQNVIVASDCLSLINKVNRVQFDRSSTGAIVHDIKEKATTFVSCTFKHVSHSCNEAAHTLAKSADHVQVDSSCWFNAYPDVIRNIICNEQVQDE